MSLRTPLRISLRTSKPNPRAQSPGAAAAQLAPVGESFGVCDHVRKGVRKGVRTDVRKDGKKVLVIMIILEVTQMLKVTHKSKYIYIYIHIYI